MDLGLSLHRVFLFLSRSFNVCLLNISVLDPYEITTERKITIELPSIERYGEGIIERRIFVA